MSEKAKHVLLLVLLLAVALAPQACARSVPAAPPEPGIKYDLGEGAQITKVSWYMQDETLWLDVTVRNASPTKRLFEVGVRADEERTWFIVGKEDAKPASLEPGKEQTVKVMTGLAHPRPSRLQIRVVPVS